MDPAPETEKNIVRPITRKSKDTLMVGAKLSHIANCTATIYTRIKLLKERISRCEAGYKTYSHPLICTRYVISELRSQRDRLMLHVDKNPNDWVASSVASYYEVLILENLQKLMAAGLAKPEKKNAVTATTTAFDPFRNLSHLKLMWRHLLKGIGHGTN
jgi:hypothetical protein